MYLNLDIYRKRKLSNTGILAAALYGGENFRDGNQHESEKKMNYVMIGFAAERSRLHGGEKIDLV